MPKLVMKIYLLTLVLAAGYLVLLVITGVAVVMAYALKHTQDGLSRLNWKKSNLRVKLYEQRRGTKST